MLGAGSILAGAFIGAGIGALSTTAMKAGEEISTGNVRSAKEAFRDVRISAASGFITGAFGAKFPGAHRLTEGVVDTAVSAGERLAYAVFDDSMSWDEKWAYAFDPEQMVSDFVTGVVIGEFFDGMMAATQNKLRSIFANYDAAMREAIGSGKKTNFDNEIPRSGSEWNEYLKGKYGADNVHWNINSVDDVFSDPTRLKGYTADELQKVLGNDWTRGVYGSNGGGWKLMNGDISIFYHPGGGKHGGSYYGISSGATGKIKVVNPETYIPLKGDNATIIYD